MISLLSVLLLGLSGPVFADDAGLDEDEMALPDEGTFERDGLFEFDGPMGETIIVTDEAEVHRRQQEFVNELRNLGYKEKKGKDGRTVYVSETPWKPKVIVDDDGWMVLKRRPIVLTDPDLPEHWWFSDTPVEYVTCVVAPHLCIRMGGLVISKRKLTHHKAAVVNATQDEMTEWGDAIADHSLSERLYTELPDQLDLLWYEGKAPDGQMLASWEERRAWILDLWVTRTDNQWGDAARDALEGYMTYVIQDSMNPYTAQEIADANARKTCLRVLVLPLREG